MWFVRKSKYNALLKRAEQLEEDKAAVEADRDRWYYALSDGGRSEMRFVRDGVCAIRGVSPTTPITVEFA